MPYRRLPRSDSRSDGGERAGYCHLMGDHDFDMIYPEQVRMMSDGHWTPVAVCRKAAEFLVTAPGTRVLDIGCGPGKFIAVGASATKGIFTGVEQRLNLVWAGREMLEAYDIPRADIVHGNVMEMDFRQFDAFYIFNPFQENVMRNLRIDTQVDLEPGLYQRYVEGVRERLASAPPGTRVATFWGECEEIPPCYEVKRTAFGGKLQFWVRNNDPA